MNVRLTPEAEADLTEAYAWYRDRGPELGADFLHSFDQVVETIRHHPEVYPSVHGSIRRGLAAFMLGVIHLRGNVAQAPNKAVQLASHSNLPPARGTVWRRTLALRSSRGGDVWGWEKGVLKVTACKSETDKNVQDGIKFLSAGLMQAIRNPTAHEPAADWPISRQDCLDILSFLSFLFRQLDAAVYFAG